MEYCVKVELPLGDTSEYWLAFMTSWVDLAGARRDQDVIQQNMPAGVKTTIMQRHTRPTVYQEVKP